MSERATAADAGDDAPGGGSVPGRRNFLRRGNDPFTCLHCGASVRALMGGGFRNHCPVCLWSRHVDVVPGDRRADCGGLMRPVAVEQRHGQWFVEHECERCGFRRAGGINLSDPEQPDSWERVVELSTGGD